MKKAVFLDKDGTLVRDIPFNINPDLIELTPNALAGLTVLHTAGYLLILITNQSGVAKGYFSEPDLQPVFSRINDLLGHAGFTLDDAFYCPHHPAGSIARYAVSCNCRKPGAGMLLEAARKWNLDLGESWMIGDILHDIEAGNRAGCRTVLLLAGNETEWKEGEFRQPELVASDLGEASRLIINAQASKSTLSFDGTTKLS